MTQQFINRDVIVVGASAGGLEPLRDLVRNLPADLAASAFVVLHVGANSHLTALLKGARTRPDSIGVELATSGLGIERGKVYIAAPGAHLLLHDRHLLVRRGPRENMARPAIDPLFRSAAVAFGGRVIGVLLSGMLSDGVAGLIAIKRCGGVAVVQDPNDTDYPDMPKNALRYVEIDHVTTSADLASLLTNLVSEPAGPTPAIPQDIRLETAIAAQELTDMEIEEKLGIISNLTCPECHGALWEIEHGALLRYRCHVGHAYTADAVLAGKLEEVERLLGRLLRTHQERTALIRRMVESALSHQQHLLAEELDKRMRECEDDVQIVRKLNSALTSQSLTDGGDVNTGE